MPARVETVWASRPVIMCDIGQAGARFETSHRIELGPCVVKWLDYEVFGEAIWQKDGQCGVLFDELVPAQWLIATRDREPGGATELVYESREEARSWVTGLRN